MNIPTTMSVGRAAQALGWNLETIRRWGCSGKIKAVLKPATCGQENRIAAIEMKRLLEPADAGR